jgi:mannose-6-phosphate isomerase-like protein (cupin superfamily)
MNIDHQTQGENQYGRIISIQNAAHYTWGNNCDGWHLLKTESLSVIQEKMPSGTSEQLHFHDRAQQVFYILSGIATFEIEGGIRMVKANESVAIPAGARHFIANENSEGLTFLVISQPNSHGDRTNIFPNEKP